MNDCLDPDMVTQSLMDAGIFDASLLEAVAHQRLYFMNDAGVLEPVLGVSYWKNSEILEVWSSGHENDQNGQITRRWRAEGE